jgi:hypothetical protein
VPAIAAVKNHYNSVFALQRQLEQLNQVELPLTHHFAPGLYAREIFLPAGTIVIGKVHRHAHPNHIKSGHVIVATAEGVMELKGEQKFISPPGTKRALIVIEDTVWTTYHLNTTNTQDLSLIEADVIVPENEAMGYINHLYLESISWHGQQ